MDSIYNRRSTRKFTDEPISREQIKELLKAGMCAPSAHNQQPYRFIVIEKQDKKDAPVLDYYLDEAKRDKAKRLRQTVSSLWSGNAFPVKRSCQKVWSYLSKFPQYQVLRRLCHIPRTAR